jgi:hypothetical protein
MRPKLFHRMGQMPRRLRFDIAFFSRGFQLFLIS